MLRAVVLAILCCVHAASGTGTHSLRYFYTGVSEGTGLPEFMTVGMLDDVPFSYYDSNIRREKPRQDWMAKIEDPDYWNRNTQVSIGAEQDFKAGIEILTQRFNQTGGTHSLRYFYTGTSAGAEFPEFVVVGMVDDVQIIHYDSNSKKAQTQLEWMNEAADPSYWERNTQKFVGSQQNFKANIGIAMQRFNQTGGVHTVQNMYGCELDDDGTKRGFHQYGFDGKDFLILDTDTMTYVAPVMQAVATKHKWDADRGFAQSRKAYLEETCIEWLRKYVQYGRETLERRVPPAVTLLQRKARGSADTEVLCHVTGFFPRAVEVSWVRDGRDQLEERVQSGEVLPNQDGTYQLRKILTVSPEEQGKHSYSCQVDHASFAEKQNYIWVPESGPPIGIIAGVIVGVLALAAVIIGVLIWKKRQGGAQKSDYSKAPSKEGSDTSSDTAANA